VDRRHRGVVETLAHRRLHRVVDDAQAAEVVGVPGLVDPTGEQLGHEGRRLGGLVLGAGADAHRGREGQVGGVGGGVLKNGHAQHPDMLSTWI
jgi:hypothetical protein